MIDYRKFKWEENVLFLWGSKILEIVPDMEHKTQFRIKWPAGDLSSDFYNLSRAKDNAIKYTTYTMNLEHRRSLENSGELELAEAH